MDGGLRLLKLGDAIQVSSAASLRSARRDATGHSRPKTVEMIDAAAAVQSYD
jgi:hypothetical protein